MFGSAVLQCFWSTEDQYLNSLWSCIMMPCSVWQNTQDVAVSFSYRILPWSGRDLVWASDVPSESVAPAQPYWLRAQLPGCKNSEGSNFCWLQASVYGEPEIMTVVKKKKKKSLCSIRKWHLKCACWLPLSNNESSGRTRTIIHKHNCT